MPHKAVAESVTPPNRILLTCNRVHNALVSHGKRRRDFSYYNKKDCRSGFRQNQNHEQDQRLVCVTKTVGVLPLPMIIVMI